MVASRWPSAEVSFVVENDYDTGPLYRFVVYAGPGCDRTAVAAAVAEDVRSGTVDDIDAVAVVVDGAPFVVRARWEGTYASATVLEGTG